MALKHILMHDAVAETANGNTIAVGGKAGVLLEISGISGDTITVEGKTLGGTWNAIDSYAMSGGTRSTTITADGLYWVPAPGLKAVRARISTYSAGTITVWASATDVAYGTVPADGGGTSTVISNITGIDGIKGQTTMAESFPVVLPSDQSALDVNVTAELPATIDSLSSAAVNLAASTADQELVGAPGAGKQIWVYGLFMMANTAAGTITLQDEDDTALSGTMAVSDEGGFVLPPSGNFAMPWFKVATNKALEADTGACTCDGIITYAIVSVG
jgi:hypothetical protein